MKGKLLFQAWIEVNASLAAGFTNGAECMFSNNKGLVPEPSLVFLFEL